MATATVTQGATFVGTLRARMREKGLTATSLAARSGIKRETLRAYLKGRRLPGATNLLALAEALECDPRELLPTASTLLGDFSRRASDPATQTWSISKIRDYLRCPAYFWFRHVAGTPAEEPATPEQVIGQAVHAAVEQALRAKMGQPATDPEAALRDALARETAYLAPDPETGELPPVEGLESEARSLLDLYLREVAPGIRPVAVEQRVEVRLAGVPFTVVLDVATEDGWVRDLKTTGRRPAEAELADNLQATACSLGYRQLFGRAEEGIAFDYLIRRKRGPEALTLTAKRGPKDHARLERVVEGVVSAVSRGAFYPNPDNRFGCARCPFREMCLETF